MRIEQFISRFDVSLSEAANIIGVSSEGLRLWAKGQRMPGAEFIERIKVWSGGAVTANDFHESRIAWLTEKGLFHPDSLPEPIERVSGNTAADIPPADPVRNGEAA